MSTAFMLARAFWAVGLDRVGNHFEDVALCGKGWFGGWPKCPGGCGGDVTDNWFDRSLCACGAMHTRCAKCGTALDPCDPGGAAEGDA